MEIIIGGVPYRGLQILINIFSFFNLFFNFNIIYSQYSKWQEEANLNAADIALPPN